MIYKLTEEQEKLLVEYREKYLAIGLDTTQIDYEVAKKDISDLYMWGGQVPPGQYLHFSSPIIAEMYLNLVCDGQLSEQLSGQLRGKKLHFMGTWFNGQQDVYWIAFYDFCEEIGVKFSEKITLGLEAWKKISKSCHWFYPFREFCIIVDKPYRLYRDAEGRLHNDSGMAIEYTDGWGICAIHGVRVPDWIILHHEQITVEKITAEENAEVRRIMMGKYGIDRYIADAGAKELHRDECGTLYRLGIDDEDDDPITVVKVINSTPESDGTYKPYFLVVPPTMETARQAVAWTFGMDEKDYAPVVES